MLGLIGTLEMAKRSLNTNQAGIELTGHNLSNLSNAAYARQRLKIQTGNALPSPAGPTGTGAVVASIEQVRSQLLDSQIVAGQSVSGFLESLQKALQYGEVNLGQEIDTHSSSFESITASRGVGGQPGLEEGLSDFFNALQALSTNPASTADRQVLLLTGDSLAQKFNRVNERFANLGNELDKSVTEDVTQANQLIQQIADLGKSITTSEAGGTGSANDLIDRRQEKLEQLSKIVDFQTSAGSNHSLNLSIGGIDIISNNNPLDSLTTFVSGGRVQVAAASAPGTALTLNGGSIYGTITARDGAIADLSNGIDTLAATLISGINQIHQSGYALDGTSTGQPFFTGTGAGSIAVNSQLMADPSLIQASGDGVSGDNTVALRMAQLAAQPQSALGGLKFSDDYHQLVANYGQSLSNVNDQVQDQDAVNRMFASQRDSLGGVSIDEEMSNLITFQRAFQASAKMVSTIDDLLQTIIGLAR